MLRGGWGESIYLAGTGGEINSVHFCRVIATTHHCFLSGILSHFTAAWRSTRQAVFLCPSFYHLYLFLCNLYLFSTACIFFSKIQAKKIQASHSGLTLAATPASPFLAFIPAHLCALEITSPTRSVNSAPFVY